MKRALPILIVSLLALSLSGCALLGQTTNKAFEMSAKEKQTSFDNVKDIATRGWLGFAKSGITELVDAEQAELAVAKTDVEKADIRESYAAQRNLRINRFAQAMQDIGNESTAFARAEGLDNLVGVYIMSRESWLTRTFDKWKEAAPKKAPTTQPAE